VHRAGSPACAGYDFVPRYPFSFSPDLRTVLGSPDTLNTAVRVAFPELFNRDYGPTRAAAPFAIERAGTGVGLRQGASIPAGTLACSRGTSSRATAVAASARASSNFPFFRPTGWTCGSSWTGKRCHPASPPRRRPRYTGTLAQILRCAGPGGLRVRYPASWPAQHAICHSSIAWPGTSTPSPPGATRPATWRLAHGGARDTALSATGAMPRATALETASSASPTSRTQRRNLTSAGAALARKLGPADPPPPPQGGKDRRRRWASPSRRRGAGPGPLQGLRGSGLHRTE
jgi:hypothetical protein